MMTIARKGEPEVCERCRELERENFEQSDLIERLQGEKLGKIEGDEHVFYPPFKLIGGNNYDYIVDAEGKTLLQAHWEYCDVLEPIVEALNEKYKPEAE